MPIRPETLLRDAEGRLQPPQDLLDRIERSHPRVSLRYTKAAWAIIETWPENSPRWAAVQDGSMSPEYAFDICGYLPLTCGIDEAPAYIERELRSYSAEQFAAVRHAVQHWNDVTQDQQVDADVLAAVSDALDADPTIAPSENRVTVPDAVADPPPPTRTPIEKARAAKAAKKAAKAAGETP